MGSKLVNSWWRAEWEGAFLGRVSTTVAFYPYRSLTAGAPYNPELVT